MVNIAVIEDDMVLGPTLVELLLLSNFKVKLYTCFAQVKSALNEFKDYDLVISDFYLGDGTFREVSSELDSLGLLGRTICMTAASAEEDLSFARINASQLMLKPFRYENLLRLINSYAVVQ